MTNLSEQLDAVLAGFEHRRGFMDDASDFLRDNAATLRKALRVLEVVEAEPSNDTGHCTCKVHECKRVRMEMQAEIERLRGLLRDIVDLRDATMRSELHPTKDEPSIVRAARDAAIADETPERNRA